MPIILATPREGLEFTAQTERRGSIRHRLSRSLRCLPLRQSSESIQAEMHNISQLGIALALPHKPTQSMVLAMDLPRRNGSPVRTMLGRVVYISQMTSRSWLAGCAFITELADQELSLFSAQAIQPTGPDHRRWRRFPCRVETVCTTSETMPGERRSGTIIDISPGGVGVLLRCQFPAGTLFFIDLPGNVDTKLVRVVRILERDGHWFHGCEFAGHLAKDDLRVLLR